MATDANGFEIVEAPKDENGFEIVGQQPAQEPAAPWYQRSLLGESGWEVPSGAGTTVPAVTIPLSIAGKTAAGMAHHFTTPEGVGELGALATPAAPLVPVKWAVDMIRGGVQSAKKLGEDVADILGDTISRNIMAQNQLGIPPKLSSQEKQERIQTISEDAVNTALGIVGGVGLGLKTAGELGVKPTKTGVPDAETIRRNQEKLSQTGQIPEGSQADRGGYVQPRPPGPPDVAARPSAPPDTGVNALRPAVKLPAGDVVSEAPPATHAEILKDVGVSPKEIPHEDPSRGFVLKEDPQTLLSRKQAEKVAGVEGTAKAGGLDSRDLPAQPMGLGAATTPEFPPEISKTQEVMGKAVKSFDQIKAEAAKFWAAGDVRKQIASSKDAGESQAAIYGRQMGNEIRQPLKRLFPKDLTLAEDAMSFVVESRGNVAALPEWRTRINESIAANPAWKRKASDAIDFAVYHWDQLAPLAEKYKTITDKQIDLENERGIDTLKREGYVMHEQDIQETPLGGSGGNPTGFRKVRQHETLADSISAGIDPKTINAVDLLQSRVSRGGRLIANRTWIEGLKEAKDPTTSAPVATDPAVVKRADGSTYFEPPRGYTLEYLQHQPVAIQHGYEGIVTAVSDPSWFSRNLGTQSLMKWNGAGKSISLMLDTFHLGRVSFWDSLIKGLGIKTFEAPIPSWAKALITGAPMKGITLADFTVEQLREMAKNGEIPKEWLPSIEFEKGRIDNLVKGGYNIGRISDAMHQELIRKIPVFGTFNKWLFEQYQRSAMVEVGLLEFERLKSARPEMSDIEVGRKVARDLNTRFGNLGRQGWFKSRTAQDLSRLVALAPEWNQGLIRSELGAVKQAGELVLDSYNGKRIYSGVLLRSVGGMALAQFAANQLINYITRGKPTWENEEEGIGPKISAWIPDKIGHGAGFFLNPLALAAETTHLLMQKFERTKDFHESLLGYLRSRSSVSMRPVMTFITRSDFLGRKLKSGTVWGEMVKDAIPRPIGTAAGFQALKQVVTGRESEIFPGQFQRQALSSMGVRTDVAPAPAARISQLAREFNRKRGVTPSAEFYVGDYQPIASALSIHNEDEAKSALTELLKQKTPAAIKKHFDDWPNHPFTGKKSVERQFKSGLNPEQRKAYADAVRARKQIAADAIRILNQLEAESKQKRRVASEANPFAQ